jgi:UDP-3-O-acyl N-acetylglucosamine deacetylase
MINKGRVLIVDDDAHVIQTVTHLLHDEGFDTAFAIDGHHAIQQVQMIEPDVVLLELWLPGQDGMETLRRLRSESPKTVVVMMSGHGSLRMAVKAMQLGAADYLEKPFAIGDVIHAVRRALLQRQLQPEAHVQASKTLPLNGTVRSHGTTYSNLQPISISQGPSDPPLQRTLCRSVVIQGQGLQSGSKTGLVLSPLPPYQGILFRDLITREQLPADVKWVDSTQFCTSLSKGSVKANTVEHLMSALHAYQITNVLITLGDEVPFMDGSSLAFCQQIEAAGIVEQEALAECFVVNRCYRSSSAPSEAKSILIEPYDGFRVTYRASYPAPIGTQEWIYEHHSGAHYRQELAPARTFGFVKDVEAMHEAGLIPGGRLNNTILLGDGCMVNTTPLRFPNEFVRHKILDIMGDFYLLGQPIRGHIQANMTGHTDNIELVRQLQTVLSAV